MSTRWKMRPPAGSDRRGCEPGADRKGADDRHQRHRPVPHREPQAGHVLGDLLTGGLLDSEARGESSCRARSQRRSTPTCASVLSTETVTVTGESPIVDVQNTTQQRVLSHDVIDIIPTGRSDKTLATLIPGVSIAGAISQDVGGTQDQVSSQLTVHGSRGVDQRLTQNGVSLGITANGANTLIVATNLSAYQEVTIDTGAVSAELSTGGVRVNYIPKDGGNRSVRHVHVRFRQRLDAGQ